MNELISVIVPVYNVELYLSRCLDSLLAQTYCNLEIILVDDGSTDKSRSICDAYAARDGRVTVIHTENRGAFAARNTGLDHAAGRLIGFVDADDRIAPTMYETLNQLLIEYDADIAQCELVNDGAYAQARSVVLGETRVYEREELTRAMFREEISHNLWSKLYRAELWREMRFPEGYYHIDAVTIAGISDYCRRLVRTDEALYLYNTTNQSITRGHKRPLHLKSMVNLFSAFDRAAQQAEPEGSVFICREIPSYGRLILAGGEITREMERTHIRTMHQIFLRHWDVARKTEQYCCAPAAKRLLWRIYAVMPRLASALVGIYGQLNCRNGKSSLDIGTRIAIRLEYTLLVALTLISPRWNTCLQFWRKSGTLPDLDHPRSFSEKLSWLKLYRYAHDPLVKQCADKLRVREYIQERGFGHLLNELYSVYTKADEIDFDALPKQFVLKWNYGSGYNLIVSDKSALNRQAARTKLRRWGHKCFWGYFAELQYRGVDKRILCERYLGAGDGTPLLDYKFYCFHGQPLAILVIARPEEGEKAAVFLSPEWEVLSDVPARYRLSLLPNRPEALEEMLSVAAALAEPFPFVRVDFYVYESRPVFGELTFTPAAGLFPAETDIDGKAMGEYLHLDI